MRGSEELIRLRARLRRVVGVVASAVVAEAVLYYFFLSRPYFRPFFAPFALAVLVVAVVGVWRVMRPRGGEDRRRGERRVSRRRAIRHQGHE